MWKSKEFERELCIGCYALVNKLLRKIHRWGWQKSTVLRILWPALRSALLNAGHRILSMASVKRLSAFCNIWKISDEIRDVFEHYLNKSKIFHKWQRRQQTRSYHVKLYQFQNYYLKFSHFNNIVRRMQDISRFFDRSSKIRDLSNS